MIYTSDKGTRDTRTHEQAERAGRWGRVGSGRWFGGIGSLLGLAAMLAGGCSVPERAATLTVRNDAMVGVDVHYAVLSPDGTPATAGEAGVGHLSVRAGGLLTRAIEDPTGALGAAERGSTVMRVLVTLAGGGPEEGQWVDLKQPGPFVLRASPMGAGVKIEREVSEEIDDRQMQELIRNEPPQPGRASRP